VRNVLSNWGAFVFNAVVGFLMSPVLVHGLGDAAYGVWVLLVSMVGYLGLLDMGVRGAVTRFVARFYSGEDHQSAGRLTSTAVTLFVSAALLVVLVSAGLSFVVDRAFHIPPALVPTARVVVVLCGLNIAVSLVAGIFGGIVAGMQRFDYNNGIEIAVGAVRALAIVGGLRAGWGLIGLACIQLAASVARGLATAGLARRLYPQLVIAVNHWDRRYMRTIVTYGLTSSLLQAMGSLVLYSDSLVIGALLPVGMVTFFAVGSSLIEYARSFVSGISYTVMPMASALEAKGEAAKLERALVSGARIATLVVLPMVFTFMLRGEHFIRLWMGPEYGALSGQVLWVLSLALWAVSGYQIITVTMLGVGKHTGLIPGFAVEAVCNLALSIALVPSLGIIGSAWGTTIPRLAASLLFAPWYVRRTFGIPMRSLWLAVWVRPSFAMVPFAAATYALERLWPTESIVLFFAQVALALPVAAIGAWLLCLAPPERQAFAPALPAPLRRVMGYS
jgi:O-antigen/teichoic acid export membrane protein